MKAEQRKSLPKYLRLFLALDTFFAVIFAISLTLGIPSLNQRRRHKSSPNFIYEFIIILRSVDTKRDECANANLWEVQETKIQNPRFIKLNFSFIPVILINFCTFPDAAAAPTRTPHATKSHSFQSATRDRIRARERSLLKKCHLCQKNNQQEPRDKTT